MSQAQKTPIPLAVVEYCSDAGLGEIVAAELLKGGVITGAVVRLGQPSW